jgi:chaperonin GroEL (HSP60 family)
LEALIADAMEKVGTEGVITVEEAKGTETEVKTVKVCNSIVVTSPHTL